MYMILWWKDDGNYLTHVENENKSIKLFDTLMGASTYVAGFGLGNPDNLRVISIEGVTE